MNLHDRYLHFPTLDISVLQIATIKFEDNNIFVALHRLIQSYNHELTRETLDISKLEMCRMLLCYEYQLIFSDVESCNDKKCTIPDVTTCFSDIEAIFPAYQVRSTNEIAILRDIIILEMMLYCDTKSIKQHLQNFLNSYSAYFTNSDSRAMHMKILKYFLETLCLHRFLYKSTNKDEEIKELGSMYLEIVKLWMKIKEDSEWKLFASMLPILVDAFTAEYILFPLWDYILNEISDLKEFLIVQSIIADICFPLSTELTYISHNIFSKNTFWLLILKGLRSTVQQYRKQALYIMKKATDSMEKICILNLELAKAQVTPFICSKSDNLVMPTDCIKQKFFLVYEALEEKQYHLIAPALTHINSLVKANKEHKFCQCFNIIWLQCIFEKVLQHGNNNIVKWGVLHICKSDGVIFDDQFLELFANILNNTLLYECQTNEDCPEIVRELSAFFRCVKQKKSNLLNRFLKSIGQVTWGPVAIFYMMHMLRTISHDRIHDNWQANELNVVKSLIETNLNIHSHVLRISSQIELLRAIPNYVQKIDDLTLLANVLGAFPSEEGLARKTSSWDVIATWLQRILMREDAISFVEDTCAKYMCENADPEINPKTFALMIFLFYDANFILFCKTCTIENVLNNWLCSINDIDMRPYANIRSSIDVVEFVSHLLNFSSLESSNNRMARLISLYIRITFKFLIKNMRKMTTEIAYEDYTRYVAIVSSHIFNASSFMSKKDVNDHVEKLQDESIRLLKDVRKCQSIQYLYGLYILHLSQNILILPIAKIFYVEQLLTIVEPISVCADMTNSKGKIASEYYLLLSKLMHQYLVNSPTHSWISTATLLSNLLTYLELGGTKIISEIAATLTVMIDHKVIRDENDRITLEYIFRLCWKYIFVGKKNNIFWTAVQSLAGIIINNKLFRLPNIIEFVTEFVDQLIEEGENTPKFKRILLSKMEKLDMCNLIKLEKPLLNCLLHGPLPRRDKRIENHAHLFIIKHLEHYYPKHILISDHNNDTAVRALAVVLLHKIICCSKLNYATTSMSFIFEILERYKNKRYFNDSYIHKLKHRLMQILLIFEPVLNEEHTALLQKKLSNLIFSESNQHSIRLMQEWLMIRILVRNVNLHTELWTFFEESIEKRPGCTISATGIIYHVARLLSDNIRKNFIRKALPYIAQCCLGQQFNMRLYNQFILVQLYELMENMGNCDSILEYKGIYRAAKASLQQGNSAKNSTRIQDDFYFSNFHPINDYSLQTIYFELPRLTNISCDEWIDPDMFKAFMFEQNNEHPLQLYNMNSFLFDAKTSIYFTKSVTNDVESLVSNVETYMEGLHDIQKKIDPSKPTTPLYSEILETMEESILRQNLQLYDEGLIVVASFVSRLPNLGGIARTCEIFGVKTLIVENLDHIKDKEFQCLSVSAEKWINMLQVKPYDLKEYLLAKKNTGWSLIGVEQTANSVNLLKTRFEKKTILVLGNEKDGIPANFIPLFDMCIEIPQVGVIRSLNVHVTAAICIWQYASQYMLK